ncbi:MAG: TraB/GumN family protein [Pseudomonadota bacterium]
MTNASASADHSAQESGWAALAAALVLGLLLALSACSSEKEANEVKPYPPPDPLFYELANADGEVEGWLLGTIHALPEGVSWRTPEIDRAVDEADLLVVEVATLGETERLRQIFADLSRSSGLPDLGDRVSSQIRPDLEAMVDRSNISRAHLRSAEDWAAAIMLSQVDAPGEPEHGVDRALIEVFDGRRVFGLETAQEQLGIFDKLAADDQRELLEGTVAEWKASRDNPERLMRAWLVGNIEALEEATSTGIMADPELRHALLVRRNKDWMTQLTPMLSEEERPLIAVGAAHLVGPDGMVTMLQAKGYTLRRIPAS